MDVFTTITAQVRKSLIRCSVRGGVLIALSGGADSVALLRALCALREEHDLHLAAAEREERFCGELCRRPRVPLLIRRVRVDPRGSLEAAARAARYDALRSAMAEADCGTLALAHHRDDQCETVLLHLLYGAGADGLGGMAEYAPPLWRPLLHVSRQEIREALRELNQDWRAMQAAFPQAALAVSRAADILREENDCLNEQSAAWLDRYAAHGKWPFLLAASLLDQHIALRRRILRVFAKGCAACWTPRPAQPAICRNGGRPCGRASGSI